MSNDYELAQWQNLVSCEGWPLLMRLIEEMAVYNERSAIIALKEDKVQSAKDCVLRAEIYRGIMSNVKTRIGKLTDERG